MTRQFSSEGLEASDLAEGLFTTRLANGLKIIIREDHRSPVAVCNVWVRVGSNREPEALRGWSHGIEHMLFKGTGRRKEGDFAREVAEAGGSTNAGTGYETTNYHITVPSDNLAVAIDILGDALFHSEFDPTSLDAERQVLVHENHMYDDVAFGFGVTWRWGMEMTFDTSPYRHPIGGRDENLQERDRDDILAFWRSAYRPDNMTVVVAGDVDPAAALKLIEGGFGDQGLPSESAAEEVGMVADPPAESPHTEARLRIEFGDIKKAYCKLIFPAPGERHGLAPATSVVRRVLGDGRSCRIYRRVQEELKLVDNFSIGFEGGHREGVAVVDLETDPERLAGAIVETTRVLGDLGRDGCTENELARARTRVARSFVFGTETAQGQAGTLGQYDTLDDLPGAFQFPDRVAAVSSPDVAALCRGVFRVGNACAMIYLPEGTDPTGHGIPTDASQLAGALGPVLPDEGPTAWTEAVPPSLAASGSRPLPLASNAPEFTTVQLPSGIEFDYRVDRSVPVMAIAFSVTGGATAESARDAGLSALTHMAQVKGVTGLDAEALYETLEGQGAALSPMADRDYGGLVLTGLADRLDQALELTGRVILEPSFLADEFEQEKRLALEQLASMADAPFQAASLELRKMVYGDHPYGRPLVGTEQSIPGLDREAVLARHSQAWTAHNLQIVVSGDCDPDDLADRIENMLTDLPTGQPSGRIDPGGTRRPDGVETVSIERQQNQSVVLTAWPGPRDSEEHRVPLMMLREILNGQSGRLFEQLRNRRSLCYNTGVLGTAGFGQGMLVGYVLTAPETADQAREALVAELAKAAVGEADREEFERARTQLLGGLVISSQSNGSRVGRTLRDRVYGRSANNLEELVQAVRQCTPGQVREAAAAIVDPDNRFDVLLGPD